MYLRACLHRAARARAARTRSFLRSLILYVQSVFYTNSRGARGVRYCPSDDERSVELLAAGATSTGVILISPCDAKRSRYVCRSERYLSFLSARRRRAKVIPHAHRESNAVCYKPLLHNWLLYILYKITMKNLPVVNLRTQSNYTIVFRLQNVFYINAALYFKIILNDKGF